MNELSTLSVEQKWIKLKFTPKGNYPSRMGYFDQKGDLQHADLTEGLILELPQKYALKDWWDAIPKVIKRKADRVKRRRQKKHREAPPASTGLTAEKAFNEFGAEIIDPVEAKGLATMKG